MLGRKSKALGRVAPWLLIIGLFAPRGLAADERDTVVATVGERAVRLSDVYRQIEALPLGEQVALREQFPRFVDSVVREELLFQYILTAVLPNDPAFRDRVKALLVQTFIEQRTRDATAVSAAEVRAYYDANSSQVRGEHWRLRHIPLVSSEDCDRLLPLATSEARFEALAREHGTDPELAASGGDVGYFMAHHDVLGLGSLVFKLPLHQPFKFENQDGCHLVWMTEHIRPPVPPVEAVYDRLEAFLRGRKEAKAVGALVETAARHIPVTRSSAGN